MNEFTPFLCGAQVDLTMYSTTAYHVTGEDEIAMTPEYPVEEATYARLPRAARGRHAERGHGRHRRRHCPLPTLLFLHRDPLRGPARRPSSSSPWRRVSIRRSPHR